jgi:hypothetical protein
MDKNGLKSEMEFQDFLSEKSGLREEISLKLSENLKEELGLIKKQGACKCNCKKYKTLKKK